MAKYALLEATLNPRGELLSNLHFGVIFIGSERKTWEELRACASELRNVDFFESISTPFARGIDPETGFIMVYRIQRLD